VLIGFGFLVLGIVVGVGVIAHLGGQSMDEIRDVLLERPWRALVPAGMFMSTNGLAMIIGFEEGTDPGPSPHPALIFMDHSRSVPDARALLQQVATARGVRPDRKVRQGH
jgi:hypothetical protein